MKYASALRGWNRVNCKSQSTEHYSERHMLSTAREKLGGQYDWSQMLIAYHLHNYLDILSNKLFIFTVNGNQMHVFDWSVVGMAKRYAVICVKQNDRESETKDSSFQRLQFW